MGTAALYNSEFLPVNYGFTGREYDTESGYYYNRARMYDPDTATFLTRDPLGPHEGGDWNSPRYAGNNPVNFVDSDGRCPVPLFAAGAAAAVLLYTSSTDTPGQAIVENGYIGTGVQLMLALMGGGQSGASVQNISKRNSPDQTALIDLAKQGHRTGLTKEQTYIMRDWAKEYNVPVRIDPGHPGTNVTFPHSHIGPVNHIPIIPGR